jgi:hypothetical protein
MSDTENADNKADIKPKVGANGVAGDDENAFIQLRFV